MVHLPQKIKYARFHILLMKITGSICIIQCFGAKLVYSCRKVRHRNSDGTLCAFCSTLNAAYIKFYFDNYNLSIFLIQSAVKSMCLVLV